MRAAILIFAGVLGLGLAISVWVSGADFETAVSQAQEAFRVNEETTESLEEQQVVSAWYTNDILTITATQNTQLVRTQALLMGVISLAVIAVGVVRPGSPIGLTDTLSRIEQNTHATAEHVIALEDRENWEPPTD